MTQKVVDKDIFIFKCVTISGTNPDEMLHL